MYEVDFGRVQSILEEARCAGIDLDLMDYILALSYEERIERHESARELVLALRAAGVAYYEARDAAQRWPRS